MTRSRIFLAALALLCVVATPARASLMSGETLVATGGDVWVTFTSNEAGYISELFLDGAAGEELGVLFNNWTTPVGTTINLGSFAAGTELVFKLVVTNTGDEFFTGSSSRNGDGVVHALFEEVADGALIGFEDLFGGGDLDYDDLVFSFTNVMPRLDSLSGPQSGSAASGPNYPGWIPESVDTAGGDATGGNGDGSGIVEATTPVVSGGAEGGASAAGGGAGAGANSDVVAAVADGGGSFQATVDEPETLLMLGTGLTALVFAMRRQSVRR